MDGAPSVSGAPWMRGNCRQSVEFGYQWWPIQVKGLVLEADCVSQALIFYWQVRVWGVCMCACACVCECIGQHVFVMSFKIQMSGRYYYFSLIYVYFWLIKDLMGVRGGSTPSNLLFKKQFSLIFVYIKYIIYFFIFKESIKLLFLKFICFFLKIVLRDFYTQDSTTHTADFEIWILVWSQFFISLALLLVFLNP